MVILKDFFFKKSNFEQNINTQQKDIQKFPVSAYIYMVDWSL